MQHPTAAAASGGIELCSDYREQDFEYWPRPSELELAQLAARLARTEKLDPKQLVGEAWSLYWESCRVLQEDNRRLNESFEQEGRIEDAYEQEQQEEPLPMPKRYPVTFKEMELLLLPKLKGRTADRARIFREFLFVDYLRSGHAGVEVRHGKELDELTPEQLDHLRDKSREQVDGLFGEIRATNFGARDYLSFAHYFLAWYRQRAGIVKSRVRSDSARFGWEKRRQQRKGRTGARPNFRALRQVLEQTTTPLDGSNGQKKS